jgi:hypothetical protein
MNVTHKKNIKEQRLADLVAREGMPSVGGPDWKKGLKRKRVRRFDQALRTKNVDQMVEIEEEL